MKKIIHILGAALLLLISWQALVLLGGWNEALLPSPARTAAGFNELLTDGILVADIQSSLIRFALGYLCARLGEHFALGELDSLEGYDPALDIAADTHHLRASLAHPALARLDQALAAPELQAALDQMMGRATAEA